MEQRVYMVGFMGSGKSTVGRIVAGELGWKFLDLDEEIVRREARPVARIFEESGEPYFREIESRSLRAVSGEEQCVIALGGGAYVDSDNRAFVESHGLSVYLQASLTQIRARISDDGARPLFSGTLRVDELYERRRRSYRMARVRIDTDCLKPEEVAREIVRAVEDS